MIRIMFLSVLLLASPVFAGKSKPPKPPKNPPPPVCTSFGWCSVGPAAFSGGAYQPWIVTSPTTIQVMSNGGGQGYWSQQFGSYASLGQFQTALPYTAIYDEGPATYRIRTSGMARTSDGKCYGALMVGNGYPTTDSYRPAFATSDDCINWIYHGRMLIDGSFAGYGQTDSGAFVVRDGSPPLDHTNPGSNKFLLYLNYQDPIGTGMEKGLILVYSSDFVSWWRAKDEFGQWKDLLPPGLITDYWMPNGAFPTATLTPFGVHLFIADTYPSTKLFHLFACDGEHFKVLEANSAVLNGSSKGAGISYDQFTGELNAVSNSVRFKMTERDWGC